ncbi:MAG: hypothetical protein HYW85_06845 [Deltaproteobacteria bacterium]|nr:hypothetical protein [Deltaproteobacteria bacterium]MBI3017744.1 hypothetical protein [Deltaproteobacteria bacterium]
MSPKYTTWRASDPMGAWDIIVTLCDLEIIIRHEKELQTYVDRRAHRVDYCQEFMAEWRRLTKGQSMVCLNGSGGGFYHQDEKKGKYKLWTWEKFKTHKGCYSYFYGTCDTEGCSRGKCPQ